MNTARTKPKAGIVISLPMTVALVVLFFMPWVSLSCDLKASADAGDIINLSNMPGGPQDTRRLASASGWELACGELTPEMPFRIQAREVREQSQVPQGRAWVHLGLAVPVLMGLVCTMGLMGNVSIVGAGKIVFWLGLAGVALTFMASSVNYVDDAMAGVRENMQDSAAGASGREEVEASLEQVAAKLNLAVKTQRTPYLWVSLSLYLVVAGCGLVTMNTPQRSAKDCQRLRDSNSMRGNESLVRPPVSRSSVSRRDSLPDFGPDITPHKSSDLSSL